ncbi:type II secretion system protein [Peptoniphilus phoceensis]|uniref:type II secretion system protein n=1 Tax=Peptoniphilus phoceensis TaxID=1720298 RepID=UPI001E595E9F|nr:type II secretion system protein [Peptoniphilus phoceensis]
MKDKNKGHLMLEALFSIALLALVASTILPNIISLLENQNYIREREELINAVNSRMEEIIGESYNNEDLSIDFSSNDNINDKFKINIQNEEQGNLNHLIVSGKRRNSDEEVKMEIYLPKKGLFTY